MRAPADHYVEPEGVTPLVTRTRTMEHEKMDSPDWRELALYSAFAAFFGVVNASMTVLLVL